MCKDPIERNIDVRGFHSATSPPYVVVHVTKGKEITLRAKGCPRDVADLDVKVLDSILDIRFKDYKPDRAVLEIFITTPIGARVDFFKARKVREIREPGT